jgi:class 3 adenylate cyclase/tetratricopeptide (TPR) repeat protein
VDDDVRDAGHGAPHALLERARPLVRVRERLAPAEADGEEGDDAVVRAHEPELARQRPGLLANRGFDGAFVDLDLFAGRRLGERLEMRPHDIGLGHGGGDLPLDALGDGVGAIEAQVAGELQVQRHLRPAVDLEDGKVVDLPYLRDLQGSGEGTVPHGRLRAPGLHVNDDVRLRQHTLDGFLDAVRGRVTLTHGGAGRDPDHDVGVVRAAGAPHAQPSQLHGRLERRDRSAGSALVVDRRLVHEHVDVAAQEPYRREDDERRDEERGQRIAFREPESGCDEAGEDGQRAREVAPEVERAREQRVAAVATTCAQRDERAGAVDREHEPDRDERPNRGVDRERDGSHETGDGRPRDDRADGDEESRLTEGGEVLRLRVAERVPRVCRPDGHGDREEREQGRGEIRPRVRSLRQQREAPAAEPRDELDSDQETGGSDRDEGGAPLRRHGGRLEGRPILTLVKVCPRCGRENADDAHFCSGCALALDAETSGREERKVVTCLFCDLVGFTARAEAMDPEDVRRLLQPYHARVRGELERFGGTVEKFIGDAVMAVFGAPVAHEDDPERAVRAALAIRDTLADDELDIRIGITTGEALITLDARPDSGEGIAAGDVVNTAARIQSAAPSGEIVVDETTFRATERVVEYEEEAAAAAKGKAEPVPVWRAVRARSRVGVERLSSTAFVGREREVALLDETLARALRERQPQLVTLVGVPGIGKSRLVFELFRIVETGKFGLVYWRHGRSLPYGDGVTFWGLAEIVKAQAGVLESDQHEQAREKLGRSVRELVPDPTEADWIERHLRPLAGLEADAAGPGETAGQSFAAWRRFLETLAEVRPLVLVFEDLHWADDALLDFVDYLVDWARGVPLLALCTARPELLARRPAWGGGKVNSTTILLSALDEQETTELVESLLADVRVDPELRPTLVERSSGNPLYAEEFARLLAARPNGAELPETVQGIIAARLDTLPQDEKELLQEAAVMGRVFWLGALGRERWTLEERLHSLERKEFVTRERRSSVAGEAEYVFRHVLVRDVAYEQIPRAERAEKHLAAAGWIDSLGRPDHAELLAHHYAAALEYARRAGGDARGVADRARMVLRDAGDRAFALNAFPAAARYYEVAVELWPPHDSELPDLLLELARAHHLSTDERRERSLVRARDALVAAGRNERAAEVDALLAEVWWYRGDRSRCNVHLERAAAEVAELPDSAAKAFVLSQIARYRMLADELEDAIRIGEEALAMSELLGLEELRAHALDTIGTSRDSLGDERGLAQLEEAAELATRLRSPEAARALNNISVVHASRGDFTRQGEYLRKVVRLGEELGALAFARYGRATLANNLIWTGAWDEGLRLADAILAEEGREMWAGAMHVRRNRALARLARDDVDGALDDIERALEDSRKMEDPQTRIPALGAAARIYLELGREASARELAAELVEQLRSAADWRLVDFAFVAARLGYTAELRAMIERLPPTRLTSANHALVSEDFGRAARLFDDGGAAFVAAHCRILEAEKLAAEGRQGDASEHLDLALAFYRSVGATRYIRRAEALLGARVTDSRVAPARARSTGREP